MAPVLSGSGSFNGHTYSCYYGEGITWATAKAYCEAMGGHLASITTAEEQAFVKALNSSGVNLWIGAYRENANDWRWVTGEAWDYSNWGSGEPNNSPNVIPNETCVAIWPWNWNDLNNASEEQDGFLCEWDCVYTYATIYNSGDPVIERRLDQAFESCVASMASTEYNPELSDYLSCLARAAYSESDMEMSLKSMGFDIDDETKYYKDYEDGLTVAYTIATKDMPDGGKLALIVIRGSWDKDWASNALYGAAAQIGVGKHSGFQNDANDVYSHLVELLGGLKTQGVTYVITGHSQGAAAGNLLATRLYDEGVPSANVYDYNYACPNVACLLNPNDWNPDGVHDNIFNIGDMEDPVTFLPGNVTRRASVLSILPSTWGKFGRTYWFCPSEDNRSPAGHDMKYYVRALSQREPITSFYEYWQLPAAVVRTALGVHCPVDVVVYNEHGDPVAGVVGGAEEYFDTEFGEAVVLVDEDEKLILLPADGNYDVRLSATGVGEMTYEVSDANLASQEFELRKVFTSVELVNGKEMASEVGGDVDVPDVKLYVFGAGDSPVAEVQEDGTEVALQSDGNIASGTWGTCPWEISADGVLTIGAGTGQNVARMSLVPWSGKSYTQVKTSGTVVLPESCCYLFAENTNLVEANLSGFKANAGTSIDGMFANCHSLETIYVSDGWDASAVKDSSGVFYGCTSLVGGNGTAYDKAHVDAEYARIDAAGAPGYFTAKAELDPEPAATRTMHRLYNPNSGEHFYTSSEAEYANVVAAGWADEGIGWTAPESGDPVYRLYNANGGEHHYTLSTAERDMLVAAGWSYEGEGWRSAGSDGTPLYREYNPNAFANNHNYTTDASEHDYLIGLGWRDEGIAWYGVR